MLMAEREPNRLSAISEDDILEILIECHIENYTDEETAATVFNLITNSNKTQEWLKQ